jgi:hypothetical protein
VQALQQLSWRFAHVKQSKTGILDAFFEHFAATGEGRKSFVDWVREDYDEDALRHRFTSRGLANFINDRLLARE